MTSSIQFNATNYNPNDAVTASLSLTAGKNISGYGSDLDSSTHLPPDDPQNIALGNVPGPGFFQLSFSFDDGSVELYNLVVFGAGSNDDASGSVQLNQENVTDTASFNDFYTRLTGALGQLDFAAILKASGEEYAQNNVLSGTVTIALCISGAVFPVLEITCLDAVNDQAKEFLLIFLQQAINEMDSEGIITDDQKQSYLNMLHIGEAAFDFHAVLDAGKLQQLITAVAASANILLDDGSPLNVTIQQSRQLYDQTRLLLNL
jgi:hypothetical protein